MGSPQRPGRFNAAGMAEPTNVNPKLTITKSAKNQRIQANKAKMDSRVKNASRKVGEVVKSQKSASFVIPAKQTVPQFVKYVIPGRPAQPGVIRNPGLIK
jgi:hypothetical protein